MANTAKTRGSTTGRATTKAKPGPKPGSTRKPRALKTFKLYASDGGDQLAYLGVTAKGKKGPDVIQSAIEQGLVQPDIKFVALEIDDLVPHEVEATVNYAVKPVGKPVKRRGRPPKAATVNGTAPVVPAPTTTTSAAKPATGRKKPGPKPGAKLNKDGTPRKKPGPKAGSTRKAAAPATPTLPTPPAAVAPAASPAAAGNPFADAA